MNLPYLLLACFYLLEPIEALADPIEPTPASGAAEITIDGDKTGPQFDGIGAVSGGGGCSVLLKDYPEKQRQEILDLLFKPKFGASISTFYIEVGGDCNSTQGSEQSHMHSRSDLNFYRGYEFWLAKEAKSRNPDVTLDACAWGCPAWIGNGSFYSQDMCDYYAKWITGLRDVHGLKLDAIGCRNENHVHEDFVKMYRKTLDASGFSDVRIHAFDNWDKTKWDWCKHLETDPELNKSVAILGNHTLGQAWEKNGPTEDWVKSLAKKLNKPIWDTEEHVYMDGYPCELTLVKSFNLNFIDAGATKTVNWYLVDSEYDIEPYKTNPSMLIADSPWSGHYSIREALWGYAHYGQFCKVGWNYLPEACGKLTDSGSYVTLKSPQNDYSLIIETGGAKADQTLKVNLAGHLSGGSLCLWHSDKKEQFVRQNDVTPVNGTFTLTLQPDAIYSLSTTTGQQKGAFPDVPPQQPFPLPYRDNFSSYGDPASFGYMPHYTADIAGVFALGDRPDGQGKCLRQIIDRIPTGWGSEWMPFTVLGDSKWTDYEVSCKVRLDSSQGSAGILGRVSSSGKPKGYLFRLGADGSWSLHSIHEPKGIAPLAGQLAAGKLPSTAGEDWHTLKMRFMGKTISGWIDGTSLFSLDNSEWSHGMAGLFAEGHPDRTRTTAYYDDLAISPCNAPLPEPTDFAPDRKPIYSIK